MPKDTVVATKPETAVTRGVIPYINLNGASSDAAAFYQRAFGAAEIGRVPAEDPKRLMHCHLEINGGSLMMGDGCPSQEGSEGISRSVVMQLVVSDADMWWKRAIDAGCEVVMPLEVMFWGDRYGQLKDPFGVYWAMDEPARQK